MKPDDQDSGVRMSLLFLIIGLTTSLGTSLGDQKLDRHTRQSTSECPANCHICPDEVKADPVPPYLLTLGLNLETICATDVIGGRQQKEIKLPENVPNGENPQGCVDENNILYLFGIGKGSDEFWKYDPTKTTWIKLRSIWYWGRNIKMVNYCLVCHKTKIYVAGTTEGSHQILNLVFTYDTTSIYHAWEKRETSSAWSEKDFTVKNPSCFFYNGQFSMITSKWEKDKQDFIANFAVTARSLEFVTDQQTWRGVRFPGKSTKVVPLHLRRRDHAYILSEESFTLFDLREGWSTLKLPSAGTRRRGFGFAQYNNTLYTAGGCFYRYNNSCTDVITWQNFYRDCEVSHSYRFKTLQDRHICQPGVVSFADFMYF